MQMMVFLVEVVAIYLWLQWEDVSKGLTEIVFTEKVYTSHENLNQEGYQILTFDDALTFGKVAYFKKSFLMLDIKDVFPNLSKMQYFIETRIKDKAFQENLSEYIGFWHSEYVAGNISMNVLEEKIFEPSSLEVIY